MRSTRLVLLAIPVLVTATAVLQGQAPAPAAKPAAAKFNPPATWMYIAGTIETFLALGLIFDIYTPYVAAIAAFHLFVAGAATYKVTKKWIWVIGGIEYCVFWMLTCVVLAMLTWPK